MNTTEAIFTRRSVRKFDPTKPVTQEQIHQMLDAAMHAPSARNSRPWDFVVITDPEDKADIMAMVNTPVDYTVETEPVTTATEETTFSEQEVTEEEIYYPEETEIYTEVYSEPEEDYEGDDSFGEDYEDNYEDDYYEEIETAISYY